MQKERLTVLQAIDLVDEAASRLRLQQESKPEMIENLERSIIKMRIEIEALRNEKDTASKERLAKLEKDLQQKQSECAELTKVWQKERSQLRKTKEVAEKLEAARTELQLAQRKGNLGRAGELMYGVIPSLEQQLPKEGADQVCI